MTRLGVTPDHPAGSYARLRLRRWGAALILLFLVDAVQILLLLPGRTGELFAWRIQPEINSFILGSAYVAGGYFFIRVCAGGPWRLVAGGFPPIIVFVWLAGIATLLHLDRLNEGGLPLAAWLALYLVAPLVVPAIHLANSRRADGAMMCEELPQGLRLLLGAAGSAVVALGLIVYLAPSAAIDVWPWAITPLTARVVATVVALYGSVWLTVALRPDAAGARIPLDSQIIGLVFLLVAVARGGGAIDWDNGLAPLFVACTAAMLATSITVRLSIRHLASDAAPTIEDERRTSAAPVLSQGEAAPDDAGAAVVQAPQGERWRLAGVVLLAALVGAGGATLIAALSSTQRQEQGEPFSTRLTPIPTNRVTADGSGTLRLTGSVATVTVSANRLLDGAPHLMHIHAGAQGRCPPASAARPHRGHMTISTGDGGAFYGKALASLTTRGDTSTDSILAFTRYPTGKIRYSRTLTLSSSVANLVRQNNAVILIHGIDYNENGVYDAGLDRSDLDRSLPGEATAPALCGALVAAKRQTSLNRRRLTATEVYTASLDAPASGFRAGGGRPCPLHAASANVPPSPFSRTAALSSSPSVTPENRSKSRRRSRPSRPAAQTTSG